MKSPKAIDTRTPERIALDEAIANEPPLPPPDLPEDTQPRRMEDGLRLLRRPIAMAGIVENGVIRLLDPKARLPEHSRVIVVATESV